MSENLTITLDGEQLTWAVDESKAAKPVFDKDKLESYKMIMFASKPVYANSEDFEKMQEHTKKLEEEMYKSIFYTGTGQAR